MRIHQTRSLTEDEERRVADAYLEGLTLDALAQRFNCSQGPIRKALDRLGVPRRPVGPPKKKRTA